MAVGTVNSFGELRCFTGTYIANFGGLGNGYHVCGATFNPNLPFKPKMVIIRPDDYWFKHFADLEFSVFNPTLFWSDGEYKSDWNYTAEGQTSMVQFEDHRQIGIKFMPGYTPADNGYWKPYIFFPSEWMGAETEATVKFRYWIFG